MSPFNKFGGATVMTSFYSVMSYSAARRAPPQPRRAPTETNAVLQQRRRLFLSLFKLAEKKYGTSAKRLAAEGWEHPWQILLTTILSAQSRDEVTIPIAEALYRRYPTLKALAQAPIAEIEKSLKSINYYKTKSEHIKETAHLLLVHFHGNIPESIEELITLPGVGRKTANLVLSEVHHKDGICVDTHVHRLSNVLGLVHTKTPHHTEKELEKIAPCKYWSRINRLFVLWGKEVPGYDKDRLLNKLKVMQDISKV